MLVHGGKGVHIQAWVKKETAVYLMLYKAALPQSSPAEAALLLQHGDPFGCTYMFTPSNPLALFDLVEQMHAHWQQQGELGKLQAKAGLLAWAAETAQQWDFDARNCRSATGLQSLY